MSNLMKPPHAPATSHNVLRAPPSTLIDSHSAVKCCACMTHGKSKIYFRNFCVVSVLGELINLQLVPSVPFKLIRV